jgi:hypothetical protein
MTPQRNHSVQTNAESPLQAEQQEASSMAAGEPASNHPLDYNPVTNEHTAAMTLCKKAAMDYYQAGK